MKIQIICFLSCKSSNILCEAFFTGKQTNLLFYSSINQMKKQYRQTGSTLLKTFRENKD